MEFAQQTLTAPVIDDALPNNTDDVPNQANTLSAAKFFFILYQNLLLFFSFLNKKIDQARPWKQFVSYEKTPSFTYSNYKDNVLLNLKTYYSNYIIISACVILLLFCFKMFILRDLLCMAAICLGLKVSSILRGGDSYTISGHSFTIPVNYQLIAVVLIFFPYSGVVWMLYSALYALIGAAIFTALHGALHDPKLSIPPRMDELYTVGPCNV